LAALSSLSLATALACGFAMTGCGGDSNPTTPPDTGVEGGPDVVQDRGSDTTTPDANEGGVDVTVDRGPDVTPIPDAGGPDAPVLPACGAPTFMPATGTIQQGMTVTVVPPTGFPTNGTIYYTIDKTQPFHGASGSSPIYTGPIQVNGALTINAIAYAQGTCTDSALASASYTTTLGDGGLAPPAFTPPAQTQNNDFTLALASTPGSTICYTIDGVTTPTCNATTGACTGSSTYSPGSGISINGTITNASTGQVKVQALACAPGSTPTAVIIQTYGLKVAAPTFQAPVPSTVAYKTAGTTPTVSTTTISSTTSSATNVPFMRYQTDGTTPTCAVGTEVNGAAGGNSGTVTFTTSTTYMAIGCKNGYAPSDPTTAAYTVQLNPPGFQIGTGTYYDTVSPGLSSTLNGTTAIQNPGAAWVCYSTTGAATCGTAAGACGTGSTNEATTASSITKTGSVLDAITCTPNGAQYISSMGMPSQTYTLQLRPVVFNPVTGNPVPMAGTLTVHMSEANTSPPNAAWNLFCYTTDGTTMPDCTCTGANQHMGAAPGAFAGDWAAPAIGPTTTSVTVLAEGCDTTGNFLATGVQTSSYPNAGTMAPPTLVPANTAPLNNDTMLTFTNADTTESATICYTTNGSTPVCGTSCTAAVAAGATSTTGPTLTATATTIKAIACDAGGAGKTTSSASTSIYTLQVALPTITPSGGSEVIGSAVTLSTTTNHATFRYTTDGSTPTCAGGGTSVSLNATGTGPYTASFALAGTETKVNVIGCRAAGVNGAAGTYTDSTVAPGNAITAWTVPQPTFRYGTGTYDDLLTGASTERVIVNPANPGAGVTWLCLGAGASCGSATGMCGGVGSTAVTGLTCALNTDGVTQSCTSNQSITVSGSTLSAIACAEPATTIISSTANAATYTLNVSLPTFSPGPGAKTAAIPTLTVSLAQTTTLPNGNPVTPTTGATTNAYICVSSTLPVPTQPGSCAGFVGTAGWTCGAAGANVTFTDVGANTTYNAFACKDNMVYGTLPGQAYTFTPFVHTPAPFTATGSAADFTAANEAIAARDGGTAYVTWDTTNLYFGINIPGLTATNVVELYIGSTTNGTSTVDSVHTFSPNALPANFHGVYHLWWTANGTSTGVDQFPGAAGPWAASAATFTVHYNGGNTFVEWVIPLAGLTLVTAQDLHLVGEVWTGTTGSAWPASVNSDTTYAGWQTEYLNDAFLPNDANNAGTKQ
jgi:hypothetical protein